MTGGNVGLGNAQFRALFDKSLDAMLIADDQGYYVEANPAACDLLGRSREHIIGQHIANFMPPELCFETAWQQFQQQGQQRGEIQILRADGSVRDVDYAATADVWPHHHLSILRDITERKRLERQVQDLQQQLERRAQDLEKHNDRLQAEHVQQKRVEAALRQNQDQLHVLIDALPVCISYIDRHQRYRYVNANYQVWFGQTPAEFDGKTVAEVIGEAAYKVVQGYIERVLAGETVTYEATVPFPNDVRYIHGTLVPDLDSRGQVQGYYAVILDLSDRHQLEQALQDSQRKYQTLFQILPVGVSILDAEGRLVEVNQASEDISGFSLDELTQLTYDASSWQILCPDGSPMLSSDYASTQALLGNQVIRGQEQGIVRPDGQIRWISVSAAPIPLDDYGVAIAFVDITEQKETSQALRRSEEQRKLAVDLSKTGCWEFNVATGEACWNDNQFLLMGLSPLQEISHYQTWRDRVHPDDLAETEAAFNLALETQTDLEVEYRVIHPDGTVRWMLNRGRGIYGADGTAERMVGIMLDITDSKLAEEELRQGKAYFESLTTAMPQALVRKNRDGIITFANPAFLAELNKPQDEVLGRNVHDLYSPDLANQFAAEDAYILDTGQGLDDIVTCPLPQGGLSYVQVLKSPLRDADGQIIGIQSLCWNVTDRVLLEQALQASEAKLNTILNSTAAAILSVQVFADRSYRYDYCSAGCESIFGYSPEALIADSQLWLSRVHPEDIEQNIPPCFEKIFAEVPCQFEYRFCRGDGTWRWLSVVVTSQWQEELQGWYVTNVHTDISDRKQAELELETTRQFLQRILDHLPVAVFAKDAQTLRFSLWNPACIQLMGYSPEAVLGKTDYDLFPAEQADLCTSQDREAIATGELIALPEEMITAQDGSIRIIHSRKVAVYDADGQPQFVIGIAEDITERRAAEVSLRQREQEFRALAENAPDMIFRCDRQFRFLYANPKGAELSGMSASDFLGHTSRELGFPDAVVERWESAMDLAFTKAQEQTLEYEFPLLGNNHAFYSRIAPEFSSDGQVNSVLIMIREITNLKHAQQLLLQQAEQERLLNTITQHIRQSLNLDQILSTAVHEVRSLLQADRVVVYRFNPDWSGNMIAESVTPPWMAILDRSLHDPCFVGTLVDEYRLGKINRIDDLHNSHLAPCYVNLLDQLQVQASLAAPIAWEDNLWGLFCVHYCAAPHTWLSWEEELLHRLTTQLAIALQQSELHQQVKQWNLKLQHQVQERTADLQQSLDFEATLTSITDKVRDSLDEEQILEAVVLELGQRLDVECCDTGLYSNDCTVSTIAHEFVRSLPSQKGSSLLIQSNVHPEVYATLFQKQTCQFCSLATRRASEDYPYLTVLACPISDDQNILGDLWLFRVGDVVFTDAEVRLVKQVAKQCAIALRQSRLYQAAQSQVLALEKLNRLKDDFLSTVSHELRTPMSSIKMATDLLEMQLRQMGLLPHESYPSTDPLVHTPLARYVQILKDEEDREINLINDLLDLTRLDADIEPLVLTSLHLQDWLPHILEPFMVKAQQQQQNLTLTLDPSLPLLVTDLPYFQRILHELLGNACKYTPAGGTVNLSVRANLGILELVVTNSGVEIPVSERDRIFDRFYRVPNHDPWKHGGTGLGLALVQKLVACLGGTIQVDSGDHQTWFTLRLPIAPS
ncbi:MAG: PAS domain S-box protein [Synechococcales cyanobacterium K44_A2020_017]|nr:PAS domain S-box protein [Synechococcales cyanobacterium K44_A2020_017]